MLLIAHRGLTDGPDESLENRPDIVTHALKQGFDAEIDLQIFYDKPFLGHDQPQYLVTAEYLKNDKFWIHAKTIEALNFCINNLQDYKFFFHQNDDCIILQNKYIWTYPRKNIPLTENSIAVLPELVYNLDDLHDLKCAGLCSDYVGQIKIK